ncbi:MAG: polysaccharide lyase family 7 protein [Spirochaetales bacterium]|nr:polysaccharide lyase family 7 protein [Spirochaetales bacterium]
MKKSIIVSAALVLLTMSFTACVTSVSGATASNSGEMSGPFPTDIIPSLATNWKLTLPVDAAGNDSSEADSVDNRNNKAWEVALEDLIDFSYEPYFQVDDGGVRFRGHCAGATTRGSKYPRSELRQEYMGGDNYWSVDDYQQLKTRLKVTHTPKEKPEVCFTQIHGPEDEPLRIQYHKDKGVYVVWNEKNKDYANALPYKLGQMLDITVTIDDVYDGDTYLGNITCEIINESTGDIYTKTWDSSDKTGYFKVGCYTQSNIFLREYKGPGYKDEPMNAYGEVIVYSIDVIES